MPTKTTPQSIVSANYNHPRAERIASGKPWLARFASQEPIDAVAAAHIALEDVAFQRSGSYEDGFGCSTVARGTPIVEPIEFDPDIQPLFFNPGMGTFHTDPDFKTDKVKSVKKLFLTRKGAILAVL